MTVTIGLVANVYNEANALPGWLETHLPYFDDVRVLHAGPQWERSNDGTIEIMEKWRIPYKFDSINDGFGAIRTRALRYSPCDYVMLLDADERFYPLARVLTCSGMCDTKQDVDNILRNYEFRNGKTPNWDEIAKLGAGLVVHAEHVYDQGRVLREMLEEHRPDAVCSIRRHWHDLRMTRPTQNWMVVPDWQMRIVRNDESILFDTSTRMHERLVGAKNVLRADFRVGPFFDHFHFAFKRMEVDQRRHDIAVYDAIHEGRVPPTLEEFSK